jgi:hypothetical protein
MMPLACNPSYLRWRLGRLWVEASPDKQFMSFHLNQWWYTLVITAKHEV